ncbi:MAG TPA: cytochrome c [Bryobacteraceae bacterium]|nr:cytochrome c [Bryobacteraceae bacterium]
MRPLLLFVAFGLLCNAQNTPDLVKQGETIFNKTCATGYCHALRGGMGGGAPRLAGRGFDEQYINGVTARGVAGTPMPGFAGTLARPDLTAVVAYVATLNGIANPNLTFGRGGFGGPPERALPADAVRGRALFQDPVRAFGRCSTCHEVQGIGIAVATPIAKVPADAHALRELATPQVSTVTAGGEAMPALVLSKTVRSVIFYDLTSPPPVLRTADPAGVKTAEGSNWHHAMVIGSYTDADLESILIYLRLPP